LGDWLPNGLEAAYYALLIGVIVFTAVKERARRRSAVSRKVALGVRAAKLQLAKDAERKVTRAEKDLAEFQARQSREDRRSASSRTVDDVPDAALPSETQDAATSDGHATPGVNVEEQLRTYRIQATNYMRDGLWCLFECASGDEVTMVYATCLHSSNTLISSATLQISPKRLPMPTETHSRASQEMQRFGCFVNNAQPLQMHVFVAGCVHAER